MKPRSPEQLSDLLVGEFRHFECLEDRLGTHMYESFRTNISHRMATGFDQEDPFVGGSAYVPLRQDRQIVGWVPERSAERNEIGKHVWH